MVQLASVVLSIIVAPWILLKRNYDRQIDVTAKVLATVPQASYQRPVRVHRNRCSCGKLLKPDPDSVIVEKDATIGIWKCNKCQSDNRFAMPK